MDERERGEGVAAARGVLWGLAIVALLYTAGWLIGMVVVR